MNLEQKCKDLKISIYKDYITSEEWSNDTEECEFFDLMSLLEYIDPNMSIFKFKRIWANCVNKSYVKILTARGYIYGNQWKCYLKDLEYALTKEGY